MKINDSRFGMAIKAFMQSARFHTAWRLLTMTSPVRAQIITVSQKVPVEETRACLTGLLVWAEAASAVAKAPNWETAPAAFLSLLTESLMAVKIFLLYEIILMEATRSQIYDRKKEFLKIVCIYRILW